MLQGLKGLFIRKTRRRQQQNQEKRKKTVGRVCVIRTRKGKGLGPVFQKTKEEEEAQVCT
jgi:hypothetical protein